jgi:hypothetical protein
MPEIIGCSRRVLLGTYFTGAYIGSPPKTKPSKKKIEEGNPSLIPPQVATPSDASLTFSFGPDAQPPVGI